VNGRSDGHEWLSDERVAILILKRHDDEREFMSVLRKYGIKAEDPRFVEIRKLFPSLRSGKV